MRISLMLPLLFAATPILADIAELSKDFVRSDVIILGVTHDNPAQYQVQAQITAAVQPSALVFEMFTPEQAAIINSMRWDGGDIAILDKVFGWHKTGWADFQQYADIIKSDPEGIVFGAAVPQDDIEAAIFEGAAAVFGLEAEIYGLDQPLSPGEILVRSLNEMQNNCGQLPDTQLLGLIEAQRLRVAVLADTIFKALDEIGEPVIVITGNDKSRNDWGLPRTLAVSDTSLIVVTLGQYEQTPQGSVPYDEILVSASIERENFCLDFIDEG